MVEYAKLIGIDKGKERQRWPIVVGRTYVIGRKGSGADIEVEHGKVSRKHCSILVRAGGSKQSYILKVADLGSTNGTLVNGKSVEELAELDCRLHDPSHCIGFGECDTTLEVLLPSKSDRSRRSKSSDSASCRSASRSRSARLESKRQATSRGGDTRHDDEDDGYNTRRRMGIAFDYDSVNGARNSRGGSRSGGQRQQQGEQQRQDKREQRKGLWSAAPAAPAERDQERPEAKDAEVEHTSSVGSANGWEKSSFGSSSAKDKFLKLMGAKKGGDALRQNSDRAGTGTQVAGHRQLDRQLEREFWQAKSQGRGRGLGA